MDAKIFRVNYKSDFILTLTSDAGWMTPFCIKFWTGSPQLAYYASYDGETHVHCTYDPSEPTKLTVQFDDHHLPIGNLMYQVAYHFTVADFPENTEDEVTNQANVTTVIDGDTYQVMLDLNGETAPEIQFALPAYANELQRIQNEQTRIAQEQQRIAQEQTRVNQESARVTEFNGIKAEALADHQRANEDHSRATSDHQNALADRSQAASDHSRAQSDHTTAGSDHSQANSDHIRAQSDHNTALSDHQTALSDHTQANTDHTRAESDHTRATADSSTAAADHRTASTDHTQANTDHARAESDHQRVETDLAEVEEFSNSLGAYDISAANATGSTLATYPDLATALGTNGSNIPEALRKGGMSVKFVQSSDNKYVQYRYMLQYVNNIEGNNNFKNPANWQGVDDTPIPGSDNLVKSGGAAGTGGFYKVHPEWLKVTIDANNKILYGVKTDGKFYFGDGCPPQVRDYITEKLGTFTASDYANIEAFLGNLVDGDTLATLLNAKVDKVLGKSLIDSDVADGISYIDSLEWIDVKTDSDGKILEATKKNGEKVFPGGIEGVTKELTEKAINPWKGKNVVVWGDSITAQGNGDNPGTGSFMYWAKLKLGFANLYNRGVGGQSYIWNTSGWYTGVGMNGNYLNRYKFDAQGNQLNEVVSPLTITQAEIDNIEAKYNKSIEVHYGALCSWDRIKAMIPSSMRESIDLVILCGGHNDFMAVEEVEVEGDMSAAEPEWIANSATDTTWADDNTYYNGGDYDITTFSGAIASTIMKMQIWCPNAVVVLATPFPRFSLTSKQQLKNNSDLTFRRLCEIEESIAHFVGADVIDVNGKCNISGANFSSYQTDGTHPNEAGRKMFGRVFTNELVRIGNKL